MRDMPLPKDRCWFALKVGNLNSRCISKRSHHGRHEAKSLKKHPYDRIYWFGGDAREFQAPERNDEFAWSEKRGKTP